MHTRFQNSKKNAMAGLVGQFVKIFTKFLIRTVIIYYFGAEYLGLDGLFLNVISMLSLAEMGIGDAICFALYKPIAEKDHKKISSLLFFYRRVYLIIGFVVFFIGIVLIPFLPHIVNFNNEIKINYVLIYVLFLLNAVSSYWFGAYRQVLFIASQKMYVINNIDNINLVICSILQILSLVLLKNYYIYLLIMVIMNIFKNYYLYFESRHEFDYLSKGEILSQGEKNSLKKNVYALTVTKISSTIYTSSDNIIISSFIGTLVVGFYSNYAYIVTAVTGIISILFSAVVASIGDINAFGDKTKLKDIFNKMLTVNYLIYGFCFICLYQLLTPFIQLWAGEDYVLTGIEVLFICLRFLVPGLNHTCTIYRASCGLFWQTRYRTLATAIINIIVSIVLAQKWGLVGVFIGTIVAYLLTTFIVDPKVIFRDVFKQRSREFYIWYIMSVVKIFIITLVINIINGMITVSGIGGFILKLISTVLVAICGLVILNIKDQNMKYFYNTIVNRGK